MKVKNHLEVLNILTRILINLNRILGREVERKLREGSIKIIKIMMMIHQIEMTDLIEETDLEEAYMITEIIMTHSQNNKLIGRQSCVLRWKG